MHHQPGSVEVITREGVDIHNHLTMFIIRNDEKLCAILLDSHDGYFSNGVFVPPKLPKRRGPDAFVWIWFSHPEMSLWKQKAFQDFCTSLGPNSRVYTYGVGKSSPHPTIRDVIHADNPFSWIGGAVDEKVVVVKLHPDLNPRSPEKLLAAMVQCNVQTEAVLLMVHPQPDKLFFTSLVLWAQTQPHFECAWVGNANERIPCSWTKSIVPHISFYRCEAPSPHYALIVPSTGVKLLPNAVRAMITFGSNLAEPRFSMPDFAETTVQPVVVVGESERVCLQTFRYDPATHSLDSLSMLVWDRTSGTPATLPTECVVQRRFQEGEMDVVQLIVL